MKTSNRPEHIPYAQRIISDRLLVARHEAGRLKLIRESGETDDEFVDRVNKAVTQDLDRRVRAAWGIP
jgi:hypothetical protein